MTTSDIEKEKSVFASKSYSYHRKTKHTIQSLYSSGHRLDWATQPNPFRVYDGAEVLELPTKFSERPLELHSLIKQMIQSQCDGLQAALDSANLQDQAPADLQSISELLFYSMAISAWKQIKGTSESWALRVNPSSGNLHPTETHILFDSWSGIENGVYHYRVRNHSLEKRSSASILKPLWAVLKRENDPPPNAIICLTSIFWREAWKYRERAFRYCQLDLGHASAAICLSASLLGWQTGVINEFSDEEVSRLLGIESFDERPMLFIPLYAKVGDEPVSHFDSAKPSGFIGSPNQLSSSQISYDIIEEVYRAGCLPSSDNVVGSTIISNARFILQSDDLAERLNLNNKSASLPAASSAQRVMRTRRSAVEMDHRFKSSLARFSRILIDSTRGFKSSFGKVLSFDPTERELSHFVDILLYVHRVDGIAPGVYHFDRNTFDLTCLNESNCRNFSKYASCMQDIASDGIFAVSLVADMQSAFDVFGERFYRYVHQEAGFIGQLFYLTARSLDIDATGIGCFLDDEINRSLPEGMEVVYNFTFGRALIDERLSELPAYPFLS